MLEPKANVRWAREAILHEVSMILADMTDDWETGFSGSIGVETRLVGDLCFESIDVVQLAVSLEEHFQRPELPFQKLLMVDGRYVDDLRVSDLVDFLHEYLNNS